MAGILLVPAVSAQDAPSPPVENWKTSPYHGVIDGFGRTIPCRCTFRGHSYRLGETVCMNTHVGTVLTRCDLFMNNTSWIPTESPCVISQVGSSQLAAR